MRKGIRSWKNDVWNTAGSDREHSNEHFPKKSVEKSKNWLRCSILKFKSTENLLIRKQKGVFSIEIFLKSHVYWYSPENDVWKVFLTIQHDGVVHLTWKRFLQIYIYHLVWRKRLLRKLQKWCFQWKMFQDCLCFDKVPKIVFYLYFWPPNMMVRSILHENSSYQHIFHLFTRCMPILRKKFILGW